MKNFKYLLLLGLFLFPFYLASAMMDLDVTPNQKQLYEDQLWNAINRADVSWFQLNLPKIIEQYPNIINMKKSFSDPSMIFVTQNIELNYLKFIKPLYDDVYTSKALHPLQWVLQLAIDMLKKTNFNLKNNSEYSSKYYAYIMIAKILKKYGFDVQNTYVPISMWNLFDPEEDALGTFEEGGLYGEELKKIKQILYKDLTQDYTGGGVKRKLENPMELNPKRRMVEDTPNYS